MRQNVDQSGCAATGTMQRAQCGGGKKTLSPVAGNPQTMCHIVCDFAFLQAAQPVVKGDALEQLAMKLGLRAGNGALVCAAYL